MIERAQNCFFYLCNHTLNAFHCMSYSDHTQHSPTGQTGPSAQTGPTGQTVPAGQTGVQDQAHENQQSDLGRT